MTATTRLGGVGQTALTFVAGAAAALVWFAGLALLLALATSLVVFGTLAWVAQLTAEAMVARPELDPVTA
jgi:hypothetical protein